MCSFICFFDVGRPLCTRRAVSARSTAVGAPAPRAEEAWRQTSTAFCFGAGDRHIDAPLRLPRAPSSGNRADLHCQPGGPYPPCWWRPLCRPTQGPQTSPNIRGTRVPSASATPSSGDHSPLGSLITVMRGRRQSAGTLIPWSPPSAQPAPEVAAPRARFAGFQTVVCDCLRNVCRFRTMCYNCK